jgi:hypothetical protein
MFCIQLAKISTLEYLEARGINIYRKNKLGMTAYLESKGFNIYEKDNYNYNALDLLLVYKNSKRVIKYISKKFNVNKFPINIFIS